MRIWSATTLATVLLFLVGCSDDKGDSTDNAKPNFRADIQQTCDEIPDNYAYFAERSSIWDAACAKALTDVEEISSKIEFLTILERLLDDLYDPHISLNTNSSRSPRLVPAGSDLWIERDGDRFVIVAIRPRSGAAQTGLQIGDEMLQFNGQDPRALAATRIHTANERVQAGREEWAVNAAVAGYRNQPREIEISRDGVQRTYDLGDPAPPEPEDTLSSRLISQDVGYIQFNNSLGGDETVAAFNSALDRFRDTRGLVLDLRDTPGGGNTSVAEPILGRLTQTRKAYQITVNRDGSTRTRFISPSGKWTYEKPVIVLVGRWTGSMGEGMAIGLDGMGRGLVMGDVMAGLAGGTEDIALEQSGISMRLPAYNLTHVDGTSRHVWKPEAPMTADNGQGADILLEKALTHFQ